MDGPVGQQKPKNVRFLFFNKNGQSPASFSYNFVFFQTNITFLQQINVKNVHPVYSTGIRKHNLQIASLIP